MPKLFKDPGASNYYDYGLKTDTKVQPYKDREVPATDFSLEDTLAKIQKKFKGKDTKTKVKEASLFIDAFAEGFSEKVASLSKEDRFDLLSKLGAIGATKAAEDIQVPPKIVDQFYIKTKSTLGKQTKTLGKTVINPDGTTGQKDTNKLLEPARNPLDENLPKFTPKLGIMTRDTR